MGRLIAEGRWIESGELHVLVRLGGIELREPGAFVDVGTSKSRAGGRVVRFGERGMREVKVSARDRL